MRGEHGQIRNSEQSWRAPRGFYSRGWRAGNFISVTGTDPIDLATGNTVGVTIELQPEQIFDNISDILKADGAFPLDGVEITVHLNKTRLIARYNAVFARRCSQPYSV